MASGHPIPAGCRELAMCRTICVLMVFLLAGAYLAGQYQLDWNLVVESVTDAGVAMRLDVHNPSTQDWNYTFSSTPFTLYSVDGVYYNDTFLPVVVPYTLPAGASDSFPMQHPYPLSEGTHIIQAYLNIYVEGNYLPVGDYVVVHYPAQISILVGNGALRSRVPIDFYWRSTLYECIYTATELNHQPGSITAIAFYNDFSTPDSQPFLDQSIRVWMGHTFQTGLSNGWIPAGELAQVFDGLVDFPVGHNEVLLTLDAPFEYAGNQNLVLLLTRPMHSSYQYSSDPFETHSCPAERSLKRFTDVGSIDPYAPPPAETANYIDQMPTTRFYLIPNGDPVPVSDPVLPPAAPSVSISPNPFRDLCVITPKTPSPGTMRVYNLRGQLVAELAPGRDGSFRWDGHASDGTACAAGIYLFQIGSGSLSARGKLLLAR